MSLIDHTHVWSISSSGLHFGELLM